VGKGGAAGDLQRASARLLGEALAGMLSVSTHVFSEIFLHVNRRCKEGHPFIMEIG
jgi:restriction endonuclease Mrr